MRTVREECLNWLLIFGKRQLERTHHTSIHHYNRQRPHRALDLTVPGPPGELVALSHTTAGPCGEETASAGCRTSTPSSVTIGFCVPRVDIDI